MAQNHGKKFESAEKQVDRTRQYTTQEAIALAKALSFTKFDETVEIHFRLGVDPRHADQQVRGVVLLPHGTGRRTRVAVFAEGDAARIAEEAGADVVGADDLIKRVQDGFTDFEVAIATPTMMGKVGRLGKVLGPRGLMPNPKSGTVVGPDDLARVIDEARGGRVEFKLDKTANLHVPIGKRSFTEEQLYANLAALVEAVNRAKPSGAKGVYIKTMTLTTTMGPGIKLDLAEASTLKAA
ncbi:MAG: 50S ribosomal protein L1 [Anaerolineae bacterium]|nr:50S ribosomal protein L1 [Anaerolineae bacterium]